MSFPSQNERANRSLNAGKIRFHHVSLIVADAAKSLVFYRDVLGLETIARPKLRFDGAWLNLGEGKQLHLLELPNPDSTDGRPEHGGRDRHLALTVDDLAWFEHRLADAGVAFTRSASGREALFCRDPDGNALELMQAVAE